MKSKTSRHGLKRMTALLLAVVLCVSVFSIPAYAQSSEPQTEQAAEETQSRNRPPRTRLPPRAPEPCWIMPPVRTKKSFIPL